MSEEAAAGQALSRNEVVRIFGTPDQTVGSVNEPRLQEEDGVEFIYGARNKNREAVKFRSCMGKTSFQAPSRKANSPWLE